MSLSTRLIIRTVVPMVLIAWLVLLAIMTLMELRDQLTSVRGQSSSISQALSMLLLTTPRRAFEHFVYAAVIGSAIGLGQLAQSSELIAMRAVGLSKLRIVTAVLAGVFTITLLAMLGSELLSAAGDRRAQAIAAGKDVGLIGVTQRSGLWLKDGDNFINAKRAVLNESGKPVELWDFRLLRFDATGRLDALVLAQSAVYLEGQGWQLRKVIQQGLDGAASRTFAQLPWDSTLMPEQIASRTLRPARQPLQEIWQNLVYARENNLDQQAFVSALWQRLTFPLSVLALVLATTPFAFSSLRTGGLGRSIFIGVMLAVVFFVLQKLIVSLFDAYSWNMAIAYLLPSALIGGFSLARLRRD